MGRVKIQMKKVEDRQQRNIAFAKRKSGILKKAYELYTLCDVPVALILFSPSSKLFIFDAKTRVEETIAKYVSKPVRPRYSLYEEQNVERLIRLMRSESMHKGPNLRDSLDDGLRYQIQPKAIEDEIDECNVKLAEVERKLEYYLKSPNQWESLAELDCREKLLKMTLDKVQSHMKNLESKSKPADSMDISSVE